MAKSPDGGDGQNKQGTLPPAKPQEGWASVSKPQDAARVGIQELCQGHTTL